MSTLRFDCVQSNYKKLLKSESSGAMFNLSEELIDFVNVHGDMKEMIVANLIQSIQLTVDINLQFKDFLYFKIEHGTLENKSEEESEGIKRQFSLLIQYGWDMLDETLFEDHCRYIERLLQSTQKYAIKFFDTHRSDLSKDLLEKNIAPLLVQIIGALIINPINIVKRKESIRTLYAQYLSTNVNDETVLKFKKELIIQLKERLSYLMNAFKDYDKKE